MRYTIQHNNNESFTVYNLASAKNLRVYVYVQLYGFIETNALDNIVQIMPPGTTHEDILDAISYWETVGVFVRTNSFFKGLLYYNTLQDLLNAAGFTRKLSADEMAVATKWFENYYDAELIAEARQRTISRTGKSNVRYIDKMLQKWDQQGIRTTEDLECVENNEIGKTLKSLDNAQKQTFAENKK